MARFKAISKYNRNNCQQRETSINVLARNCIIKRQFNISKFKIIN